MYGLLPLRRTDQLTPFLGLIISPMGSFWCMFKCWILSRLSATNQDLSGRLSRWLHQSNCCFLWSTENYIKHISGRYVVKWFPAVVIFLHYLMQVAINRLPVDSAWRTKAVMSLLGVVLHFTGSSTNQGMLMLLLLSTLSGFTKHNRFDNAYITWINEVQAWTVYSTALGPDSAVEISQRIMPLEPMVIYFLSRNSPRNFKLLMHPYLHSIWSPI